MVTIKMKILKPVTIGALLLLITGSLVGCGKKEIDVMDGVKLEFNGVSGYGTASITNEYYWEDEALEAAGFTDKMDSKDGNEVLEALQGVYIIEGAVKYEISPNENLSNGDEVTVIATVDNESVDDYNIEFTGIVKRFKVEGLKEVEQIDLFEGVEIKFEGFAPYVKATVNSQNANKDINVSYSIDKNDNLTIGDTVIVTAEYDEESLLQKGCIAKENTKKFVVEECDRYVTQLQDIPQEMISKMNKQFEDAFRAYVAQSWVDKESLNSIEYLGSYLLTPKEGVDVSLKNIYYGVYKIDIDNDGDTFSYYSYCQFKNIIILKDGTCSVDLADYTMPEGSSFFGSVSGEAFWIGDLFYKGYEKLDSLFNNCVTKNIDRYEYESNVEE